MKDICEAIKHLWDEFHMYEVVCSRCRECRPYTDEDRKQIVEGLFSNHALFLFRPISRSSSRSRLRLGKLNP